MKNILLNTSSLVVIGSTAAGSSTLTSTIIDMQGFESVIFDTLIGTLTTGQTKGTLQVNAGNASNGSDMAALAGAIITVADADTAKLESIEVIKPTGFRYLEIVFTRNSQAAQVLSILARKYCTHKSPVADDLEATGTVAQSFTVVDPEYSNSQLTVVTGTYGNSTKTVVTTYRNGS